MLAEYSSFWRNVIPGDLFIQEIFHGVIAMPFAYLIYKKTKSLKHFLLVILFAYAIDVDHLIDYFLYFGLRFNLADFLSGVYFEVTNRAVVPFHAWEWLALLGLVAYKRGWKSLFTVLALSLLAHLIFDSITVGSALFYSIMYRWFNGFTYLI